MIGQVLVLKNRVKLWVKGCLGRNYSGALVMLLFSGSTPVNTLRFHDDLTEWR